MRRWAGFWTSMFGVISLFLGVLPCSASSGALSDDRLYSLMRPLLEPSGHGFLREWLLCGEFPNPPHAGDEIYDHKPPCVGFGTDYLKAYGGEEKIEPEEGMIHPRPDGSWAEWFRYRSPRDVVDFKEAFSERSTENAVAYAFTSVEVEGKTRKLLSVGSDDGVRVWLNGELVLNNLVARGVVQDDDLIPVDLVEGKNRILVKVENGSGGWGFCLRLLPESFLFEKDRPFQPKVESQPDADPLILLSDSTPALSSLCPVEVSIEVLLPGGDRIGGTRVPPGRRMEMPTVGWKEGPYEIRFSRKDPSGKVRVAYLPWFKGDPQEAVDRVLRMAETAYGGSRAGRILSYLDAYIRDRLGENPVAEKGNILRVHSALMEFEELMLDEQGEVGSVRPLGFRRFAYADPVDGAVQYCRAYLPKGYDPLEDWPLVINMHGLNTSNPPYVRWGGVDRRHHDWTEEYPVIVLEPHGRFNTWYKGMGIDDILRCLKIAKETFAVEEDQVYLTGASMGGGGTWEIGTRYPEIFAALAPVFGGWDDRVFITEEEERQLTPRQKFFAESYSSFARAESLLSTPVLINQGSADSAVVVQHARLSARMLARWGYAVRYWEHPGKGHSTRALQHEDEMLQWFLKHKRKRHPRQVRIRTAELKWASAHWVRVENREDPRSFIQVNAESLAPNVVRLETRNVLSVSLDLNLPLLDPQDPLTVVWNGQGVRSALLGKDRLILRSPSYSPGPRPKRPLLGGPLCDATTTPFAVIEGTSSPDSRMRAFVRRAAGKICDEWEEDQHVRPRFWRDVDLTEEDLEKYTLILVGGPEENAVTAKLFSAIPLELEGDIMVLDGTVFQAPDSVLKMIYPHPRNRDRYIVLLTATSPDAYCFTPLVRDPTGFPYLESLDYYILDGRAPDPGRGRPEEKTCLVSGSFDCNWRFQERFAVFGEGRVRSQSALDHTPRYVSVPPFEETLFLSDLLESRVTGGFKHVARDRAYNRDPLILGGRRYDKGLGVGVWTKWSGRSSIEWEIPKGRWNELKATVGLQLSEEEDERSRDRRNSTGVRFRVYGDGHRLAESPSFRWYSAPEEMDVDISNVERLRVEVVNEGGERVSAVSANLADLRLEKEKPVNESLPMKGD